MIIYVPGSCGEGARVYILSTFEMIYEDYKGVGETLFWEWSLREFSLGRFSQFETIGIIYNPIGIYLFYKEVKVKLTFARKLAIMFAGTFITAHHTLDILVFLITLRSAALRTVRLRARRRTLLHQIP